MPLAKQARGHVELRRTLLVRVTLFAAFLTALAVAWILADARQRAGNNIQRTGSAIRQLINDEAARGAGSFRRSTDEIDFSTLAGIGQLVHFCAEATDLYRRPVVQRCFSAQEGAPWLVRDAIRLLLGSQAGYHGTIEQNPGIKIGELAVTPDFDSEAAEAWIQIRTVLWIAAGILLLNVLIYLPVHRVLRPSEHILRVLGEMEKGDLSVRLPRFELVELQRIATVFNHLAERLQDTIAEQRRLAERLLGVREEERRHLARELHDEFGQCLASINAEAAYANELAGESLPALLPCTHAIARTTAQMMESLQQILSQLRPVGLEEFGLEAGLQQLVRGWEQRSRGQCGYLLEIEGAFDDLPDNLVVSLYRIVQESLTNAAKHGRPTMVEVRLRCGDSIDVTVDDDGSGAHGCEREGRHGVLGMRERALALGGSFAMMPRSPQGMRIAVRIPAAAMSGDAEHAA